MSYEYPLNPSLGQPTSSLFTSCLSAFPTGCLRTFPTAALIVSKLCDPDYDVEDDMSDYPELWFNWLAVQETSDSVETLKKKLLFLFEMLDNELVLILDAYNNDQNRKKEERLTKLLTHIAKQHSRTVEFIHPAMVKRWIEEDPSSVGRWWSTSFENTINIQRYPPA